MSEEEKKEKAKNFMKNLSDRLLCQITKGNMSECGKWFEEIDDSVARAMARDELLHRKYPNSRR